MKKSELVEAVKVLFDKCGVDDKTYNAYLATIPMPGVIRYLAYECFLAGIPDLTYGDQRVAYMRIIAFAHAMRDEGVFTFDKE